jgi:hypothetical protein
MALQCLSVEYVLDGVGMFVNLVVEKEARNIAQRNAIFFVLNSVRMPPQHMENFSRPVEIMQCQEHKLFAGTKYFLKAEPFLKMSSAAGDHQEHGEVTTQHG